MHNSPNNSRFLSRINFSRDPHARFFYDQNTDSTEPIVVPPAGNTPTPKPPSISETDLDKAVERVLNSKKANGDADAALRIAVGDAERQRARAEAAEKSGFSEAERATLQAAQELLQSLNAKDFAELKQRVETGDAAATERDTIKRESAVRAACELAGIDFKDFSTRKGVDDWAVEVKDETKDGKPVKVPYVTFKNGDKDETKPLAEKAFAEFPTLAKANGQQSTRKQAPTWGVGDGEPTSKYDHIRQEVQNKNKQETGKAPDLKLAGIN